MKRASAFKAAAFMLAASASLLTFTATSSAEQYRHSGFDRGASRSDLRDLLSDRLERRGELRDLLADRLERRGELSDLLEERMEGRGDWP